jgi:hypothetical protein
MKNFFLLVVVFSLLSFSACSQKNPPENVKKEFQQKFAGAKSIRWSSEKENEWEAEFKLNGNEMSACFDNSGKWLETEAEVSAKDLPAPVANTLKNEFVGFKTDEISIVENPEMKGYEFALKNKQTKLTVVIGADGKVLEKKSADSEKKEAANEKDEKDEKVEKEATKASGEKEVEAPASLVKAFNQKFPGAKSVEWGSESKNEWEAEFTVDGKKMSASFDSSAVWMVTEIAISEKELPAAVVTTLNKDFAGFKKNLIEIYEDPKTKGFELELKKGEASIEVIFDNAGKAIKKTELKEEDEKEEKPEVGKKIILK